MPVSSLSHRRQSPPAPGGRPRNADAKHSVEEMQASLETLIQSIEGVKQNAGDADQLAADQPTRKKKRAGRRFASGSRPWN